MSTTPVLKITHNDNIVLLSARIEQNISPLNGYKIIRNIHNKVVNYPYVKHLECTIKTPDAPDISMLHVGEMYRIFSVIEFKSSQKPEKDYITESLSECNSIYTYRPILEMVLTNFESVRSNTHYQWSMYFES